MLPKTARLSDLGQKMYEYLSEAVALKMEPRGEYDARVTCFTRKYGKLTGKVTSARKITSKLVSHLQPGNVVYVRAVERGGVQFVDALKQGRTKTDPERLGQLAGILPETERDTALWEHLAAEDFSWRKILKLSGWDPEHAECHRCGKTPACFLPHHQIFFCRACALRLTRDEVIYI